MKAHEQNREEFPSITIPDAMWRATGDSMRPHDPNCRLLARIEVNGTPMHLEAYAVEYDKNEGQHVFDEDADIAFGKLVGDDGFPLTTTTINGREYALVATPFGD